MPETLFATRPVPKGTTLPDAAPLADGSGAPQPEIVVPSAASSPPSGLTTGFAQPASPGTGGEPLARIEDKTSRIEEKLARSEASMQRVVDRFEVASARMNEVALQSELAAVRGEVAYVARRVRGVPGLGAMLAMSVVTAVLSAAATVAVMKYAPALLAR